MPEIQTGESIDPMRKKVIDTLRSIHDPEIPINIYDLGLIYELFINDDGTVQITMTLTAPNCPMADVILGRVDKEVRALEGVSNVAIELTWEPKWRPDMMSEAAKLELEFTGHTGPAHLRKSQFSQVSINRNPRRDGDRKSP